MNSTTIEWFFFTVKVLNRKGTFICDKCGSKLSNRQTFSLHNYQYHWREKKYCDLCPRMFYRKGMLVIHMERDHLKLLNFKCKFCHYKSFYKRELEQHMLRYGMKTECKICHKFVNNLKDHWRSHVKVKCRVCSNSYSKQYISHHIKICKL